MHLGVDALFNLEGIVRKTMHLNKWKRERGFSSAGRAPALQAGGQRFDPANLHHVTLGSAFKPMQRLKAEEEEQRSA